ncbi:unknown [Eubacterium sp. CAG:786]|nr:unknown [Eubacterium sp. CAG:786]
MQVEIIDNKKMVLLWRTTQEACQPIPEFLQVELAPLRLKKYKIIILTSGHDDLFESTLFLLKKNRMDIAIKEMAEETE